MPTTAEPTRSPALAPRSLRLAVADLRSAHPRRRFPTFVHAGQLGERAVEFRVPADLSLDHGLRTEVVAALLSRALLLTDQPALWLTRSGELDAEDVDLDWYAAARAAYGEADVSLAMVVITKRGWRDPASGVGRAWKRLRLRS